MGYAVFTRDAAGGAVVEDVDSLEAAVAAVERLRNEDGSVDARVFREVPLQVRTYYKVVVADDGEAVEDVAAPDTDEPAAEVAAAVDHAEDLAAVQQATEVAAAPDDAPVAPVSSLPGAFPLAAPAPAPQVEVHDADLDTSGEPARRHSLFSRGG